MMKKLLLISLLATTATAQDEPQNTAPVTKSAWLELHNPWAENPTPAPTTQPYRLPRMGGDHGSYHNPIKPLQTAPAVDSDGLYRSVLACYPEKSKFRLELELQTSYANRETYDYTGSSIGQHYIGVVAKMPLYSATEISREREKEYKRRGDTAAAIGALMSALADRNHAIRELGLYSSLEARSQIRVAQGVAETSEQVGYLERVAAAQRSLIASQAALTQHRLALVSQCADNKAGPINAYIQRLTRLPDGAL